MLFWWVQGSRSQLILLRSLNIRREIWRRSLWFAQLTKKFLSIDQTTFPKNYVKLRLISWIFLCYFTKKCQPKPFDKQSFFSHWASFFNEVFSRQNSSAVLAIVDKQQPEYIVIWRSFGNIKVFLYIDTGKYYNF